MNGIGDLLKGLPSWAGTVPQWGLFFLLAIAVIRTSPHWLETWSAMRLARSNRNAERIRELEMQVKECRVECDTKIASLHSELFAMRTQRNQEQAVIMKAILRTSNDPEVRKRLDLLEAMEASLTLPNVLQTQDGNVLQPDDDDPGNS